MNAQAHIQNLHDAKKVARNSLFILVAMTLVKAYGGYVTNLVSLLGDAAASFGDLISMMAIYVGISFSLRAPDKRFKYGYHRIETLVSLIISVIMVYFAVQLLRTSVERIFIPSASRLAGVGIMAALVSIAVSIYTSGYLKKVAQKINSQSMTAASDDKRNDAFITAGVLGGIIANYFNFPIVEKLVAMGIALAVLWVGIHALKDSILYLLDYWDDPSVAEKIGSLIRKSSVVTGVKNIRLRHAGTFIFGEAFINVNPFTDITDLRDEIHRLDTDIKKEIPYLGDFVLYVNPPRPVAMTVAIPVYEDKGLQSEIADHLSKPFHFLLITIDQRKIKNFKTDSSQSFTANESLKMVKYLKSKKVNILISTHIQAILFYYLRLNNIKVYPHFSNVKDVEHTVKLLLLDI